MSEELKIIYKDINDLQMYENNPRKNSDAVQYVVNSIQQFGFKNPIIIDKNNTIRVLNYSTVVTDEVLPPREEKKITLFDSAGALRLSVTSSNLYYIESDDNYVKVWYTDNLGDMKQYMLRCRLKTIEESFADSDLIRCNRKYVVNMEHVRVLRKLRDNYVLELDNDAIPPLPITKTYEENVLARFNSTYRGE